ncbi:GGDEF domain-containing protein [Hankyongella ginsenosidimutans]|uniref:diguanylate cyclase n=1 Tax=Hankyongella ginsenosidimutans TaxID=1763828 RepID=A0A4D7CB05_9SPHN|nr:GGDEF domain-containing protein [Hankyongella ginsenosidimutans]QCI78736.1 GGDEF domain-containing protein [Hankyongella ginsenosidimutans]
MLDQEIEASGGLTEAALTTVRVKVESPDFEEALRRIAQTGSAELSSISGNLAAMRHSAQAYGDTLVAGGRKLENATDPALQAELISRLTSATDAMVTKTQRLENQLAQSTAEIERLRAELERVSSESRTDPLTGLPNRKALQVYLDAQAARSLADRKPLTVMFCDIDHFKNFNDTWGHRLGDEVLRLVAHSLERQSTGLGFAARYGGEEFVVVLPGRDLEAASDIGEQFRDFVASRTLKVRRSSHAIGQVTMSLGIAQMRRDDTLEDLLERADAALYLAKQTGRNRVCTEIDLQDGKCARSA